MTSGTFALFGALFGLLAGACAFLISYYEYKRNWAFAGNPARAALRTGVVAFLVFFVASLVLPWLLKSVGH